MEPVALDFRSRRDQMPMARRRGWFKDGDPEKYKWLRNDSGSSDPQLWKNEWWLVVMGLAHTEVSRWPAGLGPIVYTGDLSVNS